MTFLLPPQSLWSNGPFNQQLQEVLKITFKRLSQRASIFPFSLLLRDCLVVAEGRHWREWVGGSGLHPSPGDRRLAPGGPQGACLRPGQRWPDSSRAGCHLHPAGFLCQPLPVLLPTSRCSSSCGPGLVPHKPTHRRPLPRLHPPTLGELPHCISSPGACTQLVPWQLLTHKMSKTEHVCLRLFPPSGLPPSLPRLGDRHCHPPRLQLPTPLSLPTPHPIRVHP